MPGACRARLQRCSQSQGGEKPSLLPGEATTSAGQEASCGIVLHGICTELPARERAEEERESWHRDARNLWEPLIRTNSAEQRERSSPG